MDSDKNILSVEDLYHRLFQYKSGIILIVILQFLWALIELLIPFLTQALVDQGIHHQDIHFIYLILLAQLMLFAGGIITDYFKMWLVRNIGVRLNMQLFNNFLKQILTKRLLFFNEHPYGVILQNLNDNFRIEKFLTDSYTNLINALFRLLIFGTVLYLFDWRVGLILLISVVIFFGWNFVFWEQRARVDQRMFKTSSLLRNNLLQIVEGVSDIKLNNQERNRLEEWYDGQDELSLTRLFQLKIWQYYFGGVAVINQLRDILIIFFTALSVMNGTLTLGAMLAIQYILGRLNQPMTDIMQFVQDYQDAKLSLGRLQKFTAPAAEDYLPQKNILQTQYQAAIHIHNLFFSYKETPAVKGVSLSIPYGTKVAIVGESGSGKSTLLKLLLKLLQPQEGQIKIGPQRLRDMDAANWRLNCSTVYQEGFIFTDTLTYNITLEKDSLQIDYNQLHESIRLASLDKLVDTLEEGIHTRLGQGGKTLSKGQAQRVLLARAFYKNSPYLLLDEPTSALDNITAVQVVKNIQTLYADRTVIMVTHKTAIAENMDLIFLMDDGKIVESGTHQELLQEGGTYEKLYNS